MSLAVTCEASDQEPASVCASKAVFVLGMVECYSYTWMDLSGSTLPTVNTCKSSLLLSHYKLPFRGGNLVLPVEEKSVCSDLDLCRF